jgi:hypothetical protein
MGYHHDLSLGINLEVVAQPERAMVPAATAVSKAIFIFVIVFLQSDDDPLIDPYDIVYAGMTHWHPPGRFRATIS